VRTEARGLRAEAAPPLRPAAAVVVVAGVCLAAAVIGAVAGGVHSHVGSAPGAARLSAVLGYVAVAALLSLLVTGLTLFFIVRPRRWSEDEEEETREGPPLTRLQKAAIFVGVLLVLAAPIVALLFLSRHRAAQTTNGGGFGLPAGSRGSRPVVTAVHIEWTFFLALAVAGLVILVYMAILRYRNQAPPDEEAEDVLEPAVAAGIEALESEPDPRSAVVKAWTAMEATLRARGFGRRAVETPLEYLRRVLVEVGAAAPAARRLTSLFEEARFSRHEIDERMRGDALAALAAVRSGEAHP
jgi:hypothetical protein